MQSNQIKKLYETLVEIGVFEEYILNTVEYVEEDNGEIGKLNPSDFMSESRLETLLVKYVEPTL